MDKNQLTVLLRYYPRVYAVEVHATRSRSTLYYKLFVVDRERNPVIITSEVATMLHAPYSDVYNAIGWPGHYGELHRLIGVLNRTIGNDGQLLSIKLVK